MHHAQGEMARERFGVSVVQRAISALYNTSLRRQWRGVSVDQSRS